MTEAEEFVQNWSKVWRGRDSDAQLYMELLHEGCPLINPINPITREDLPAFVEAVLEAEPDIRVVPTRWAGTDDGSVLIEWVNKGTLHGAPARAPRRRPLHPQRRQGDRRPRLLRPATLPRYVNGADH
jgi:hypothetical protein